MGILGNAFSGWHLLVLLFLVLLLFGAPKLPGLAKSLGQSMRILKTEAAGPLDGTGVPVTEPIQPATDSTP